MTTSYKELLQQREALDAQIRDAREKEVADALARVRQTVAEFELTVTDVFPSGRRTRAAGTVSKVAPKYRNPATGQTWTGRGKPPKWIQGQDRTQFAI
ncbi:H-NS family nucleoid-associated regulatory protein [Comamonas sp. NLF-1-9]|uniref:H-NS histone family protein n=1 Tax=Comamonas sp. NLF-1-9 TaxID=2853163 RepID=UPI001C44FF63|nr:H-NS histone family protein [Comamonas sp. NLF-1-9]QXL85625.1 H-NS histone family protein [Comamonas sp. NLF-1-9]